jgi:phosphate transport system protein
MNLEIEINYNITKGQAFSMAMFVQKAITTSLESLVECDTALAQSVIDENGKIKSYESKVNDSSLSTLLFEQTPSQMVSSVLALQKLNHLLESIGKHVMHIAASTIKFSSMHAIDERVELSQMSGYCLKVYTEAIDCFFNKNTTLPHESIELMKKIYHLKKVILHRTVEKTTGGRFYFQDAIELINICKSIETIGELSWQIAELAGNQNIIYEMKEAINGNNR